MWLHLTEEECTSQAQEPEAEASDPPLQAPEEEILPPSKQEAEVEVPIPPTTAKEPLFRNGDADSSDTDSDEEPNLNKANETWANLRLGLEKLRSGPEGEKKKGKKRTVVLETPEMRRLGDQMAKLEKDYLFSRKDAGMYPFRSTAADKRRSVQVAAGSKSSRDPGSSPEGCLAGQGSRGE
jgi:ATP-dependent RNA helicase DHX29